MRECPISLYLILSTFIYLLKRQNYFYDTIQMNYMGNQIYIAMFFTRNWGDLFYKI